MSSKSSKLIPTIWPLPGGNDRYLHTLDQIVKWVDSTPAPTRDKFLEWMATEYNAPKSAGGYLQLVLKMGVLESQSNGVLVISKLGQTILEAQATLKPVFLWR